MPEQRRAYFLREGDKVTLLIEENQEAVVSLLANGEEVYVLPNDEYEYWDNPPPPGKPGLSFGEAMFLWCVFAGVFFWLPAGFLLLRFLGFSV